MGEDVLMGAGDAGHTSAGGGTGGGVGHAGVGRAWDMQAQEEGERGC